MRFASFRLNMKKTGAAFFCAALCIFALCLTVRAWSPAEGPGTHTVRTAGIISTQDRTADADSSSASSAPENNPDYLGDVGGEYVSESDTYDGALSVPAHISLDRIEVSDALCKPLDYARVSSLFGYRQNPVTGKYSFHSGYDLAAPHGADIYAMYSGEVVTASYDSGYGNYVIIEHEGGFQTLYAHCSELLCAKGDYVSGGDVIALVGSTGNSTGAHLHVEFRRDGQRYDPEWVLGGIY